MHGIDVMLWVCAGIAVTSALLAIAFLPGRTTPAGTPAEMAGPADAPADSTDLAGPADTSALANTAGPATAQEPRSRMST